MYHSISFYSALDSGTYQVAGGKPFFNTWDNFKLVPTERPVFVPPSRKEKTVEVPGRDGVIDVSTALTGYPLYEDREGSFSFYLLDRDADWTAAYSKIAGYLNGIKGRAILEDDPSYFYEGYFWLDSWKPNTSGGPATVTISYKVNPYKWTKFNSIGGGWTSQEGHKYSFTVKGGQVVTLSVSDEDMGVAPIYPSVRFSSSDGKGIMINHGNKNIKGHGEKQTITLVNNGTYTFPEFFLTSYIPMNHWFAVTPVTTTDSSVTASVNVAFRKGEF